MFLRSKRRFKDGKEHRYWSIVENRRCSGNRVVQRQVLYLGEINDQPHAAWCKTISVALIPDEQARSGDVVASGMIQARSFPVLLAPLTYSPVGDATYNMFVGQFRPYLTACL